MLQSETRFDQYIESTIYRFCEPRPANAFVEYSYGLSFEHFTLIKPITYFWIAVIKTRLIIVNKKTYDFK